VERCKRNHRIVRQILRPVTFLTRLSRVDIPDSTDPAMNPKTWEGSWRTLTNPDDIGKVVCIANTSQYNQACVTPFSVEPLLSYFGTDSNTPGVDQLMAGEELPLETTRTLLPETVAILETIRTLPQYPKMLVNNVINTDAVKALYGVLPEKMSSSPSQRHIGHYKAMVQDASLTDRITKMIAIPNMIGYSPLRWRKIVDVMLEKSPGDTRIHRLRIVALHSLILIRLIACLLDGQSCILLRMMMLFLTYSMV